MLAKLDMPEEKKNNQNKQTSNQRKKSLQEWCDNLNQ